MFQDKISKTQMNLYRVWPALQLKYSGITVSFIKNLENQY